MSFMMDRGMSSKLFAAAKKGERTSAFAVSGEGDTLKPSELPDAQSVGMPKKVSK